jgi:hypothetical protein
MPSALNVAVVVRADALEVLAPLAPEHVEAVFETLFPKLSRV